MLHLALIVIRCRTGVYVRNLGDCNVGITDGKVFKNNDAEMGYTDTQTRSYHNLSFTPLKMRKGG
jgi:hypothetical protein